MTAKFAEPREPVASAQSSLFPVSIAALALVAGVLDLVLYRGLLRVVSTVAHHDIAMVVESLARFVRNLSAVLLCLGVVVVTQRAMRSSRVAFGAGRRVLIGMLAGVLFPVLGVALVMPDSTTTIVVVLIGILAGYSTAAVYGFTAFDATAPTEQRAASAFLLLFAAASLLGFVGQIAAGIAEFSASASVLHALRSCIEVTYFGLPVGLGFAELTRRPGPGSQTLAFAFLAGTITFAGFVALDRALPADYDLLLYGALRLEALESASPLAYASLFGLAVSGVTLAITSPARRHLGLGAAFVLLAGAGAGSPFAIAHVVLAAAALGLVTLPDEDEGEAPPANHRVAGTSSQVVS